MPERQPPRPPCPARRDTLRRLAALGASTAVPSLVLPGCALPGPATATPRPVRVASGLELPWGLGFLPDGRLLVTERPGRLRVVSPRGELEPWSVAGVPAVDHRDHGGLLDVLVDREFAANRYVYLSYTEAGSGADAGRNGVAVARGRLDGDARTLDDVEEIFRQAPKVQSGENLGGRLAQSADGMLFLTLGDRREEAERVKAQDLSTHHGKVVRIRRDGSVPPDNPFVQTPGARPEIWSYGHRNPQGIFLHPTSGEVWTCEHGPFGGDEVNITRAGRNYGWPVITYGCDYDTCAPIGEGTAKEGMEQPLTWWAPVSIAPSNCFIYDGDRYPGWRGDLLVGALAGMALWRIVLRGPATAPTVVQREPLFASLGQRLRDARQGPDGRIYLLTDGAPATIYRLEA
ncbi:PQQ-dependent sugar dehydrogenase [Caldimonas thermodepolymerans]|uniref:Oxidoreductase n=1 Tax=Caldimonas thermodepolymerans TaxID=215580 RepID=A0A2S5T4T2_9BURK|nr:PQQ-dependent sugar dehydrogenase [Caldimonas thermodepolymerans]PPE69887.1 oxidoreductase [Caldimonas thermodepolymerans]QPC32686.1 PQQ-dependent sugar dehydrogenase [Caldimonas thermodepolymerans]RDI03443.1 glucose/arabinose dehydrogenase [Caldimonas thermodepolymerans]